MILTCKDRLSNKCVDLYERIGKEFHHICLIAEALNNLDEMLLEYELHDYAFCKEYTDLYKQWKVLSGAFYKAVRLLMRF